MDLSSARRRGDGWPDGVLMFDETGFVKKGTDSVGVARQYCGPLGKVENCQVGVFAGYASRKGFALVDKRLFLPEEVVDGHVHPRSKCHVPAELTFQSKPQLAAAMLEAIVHEALLPFKYIVADCLYGNSPTFLDAVDACVGRMAALVAVPSETRCWLQRPQTEAKSYTYREKPGRSAW